MPKNIQQSQLIQHIASLMPHYCDRCGARHEKGDLEIMTIDNEKVVCKLECSNCKNVYLFHVNSPSEGVVNTKRSALKTDISGAEIKKFSNSEDMVSEEVLDVLDALKNVKNLKDFDFLFPNSDSEE